MILLATNCMQCARQALLMFKKSVQVVSASTSDHEVPSSNHVGGEIPIRTVRHFIARGGVGWGGGGGNLGVILVRVCEPVFQNLPHSYTWPLEKRTHSYT